MLRSYSENLLIARGHGAHRPAAATTAPTSFPGAHSRSAAGPDDARLNGVLGRRESLIYSPRVFPLELRAKTIIDLEEP